MKEKIFKKGTIRRLFSVVLALAMVFSLMPLSSLTAYAAGETGSATFKTGDGGTITLTWAELQNSTNGTEYGFNNASITDTLIDSTAFENCTKLTSITIPDSVTTIDNYAFQSCSELTSVTLPSSLTSLGSSTFRSCTKLASITIPSSITEIKSHTFYECTSLMSVTFAEGTQLKYIRNYAFFKTSSLTGISIPAGVEVIGDSAFAQCSGLTSVTLQGTVGTNGSGIHASAFWNGVGESGTDKTTLYLPLSGITGPASNTESWKGGYFKTVYGTPTPALAGTVSISGTPKFGQTLTADTTGITNNNGTLSYLWKRDEVEISGATSSTYTLVEADIDHTITVDVKSSVETGTLTSAGVGPVEKADGPAAPNVTGVACTTAANNDGKITGTTAAMEYSTSSSFTSATACSASETTNLANGTYYVRVKETSTHKAGAYATVAVNPYENTNIAVTGVSLNKTTASLAVGAKETLTATVAPANATNKAVTWSSNKTSVATVSETGEVTAKGAGTATITVTTTDGSKTATCTVTVTDNGTHTHKYGPWTVTKLATATAAGEKERTCECGDKETVATTYEKPKDHLEEDTDTGLIANTTDADKNGCNADVKLTKAEIIEKFDLTAAELSKVENGVDIAVNLEVKAEEPKNIPQADKTVAEKKIASNEKIGQYLDINLFKIVGNDKSKVTQINGKIKIQIKLPEEIKKAGTDYFIIRVHEGVATKLDLTLVSGDTYSFETDQFSTYAIGYKDSTPTAAPEETKSEETKPASPKTGDTTNMYQWILLMVAGLGVCALKYSKKRKEN